jgi:WD40 repeat protein
MDHHEGPAARAGNADSTPKPRREPGSLLSTVVLAVVAVVLLGGLGTAATVLIFYQRQGPRSPGVASGTGTKGEVLLPEGAREIATLEPPLEPIFALRFSPDGKLLAVGDGGQGVHLYDAATGKDAGRLGEKGALNAGGFGFVAPDRLVAVTRGELKLWDLTKRQVVRSLGRGPGVSYAASPEAGLLVTSTVRPGGMQLAIWGPGDEAPRPETVKGDSGENLVFSADGKLLASSGGGGTARRIKLYRMPGVELLHTMGEHEGGMGTKMEFSPDGKVLASAGPEQLRLWSVETGKELPPVEGDPGAGHCCFTADGKVLAAYHRKEKGIKLWDVATRKQRAFVPVRYVEFMTFSPKANLLAAALADRTVKLLDLSALLK